MDRQKISKDAIIAEYLTGGITYRKLQAKYGISFQTIHQWVQVFRGKNRIRKVAVRTTQLNLLLGQEPLSPEVKQLQRELRKAQLHNKLLNAIIDIAEEQLKINIRKKSGARQ